IDNDASWASQHQLKLTDSYLSASIILVKNTNVTDLDSATFALAKDFLAATEYVKQANPNAKIIYYNSPLECFEAVNRGKAGITYANSYVAENILDDPRLNRLAIVETADLADHLCIGISDSADPILLSILNKSIHSITARELNNFIFKYTISENPDINLNYFLYQKPLLLIGFLAVLFSIITIILGIMIKNRNKYNEEIKKVAYLDSVTGTDNYIKFKIDAQNLLKNSKGKQYAIVYIDIYKFSYINDTFGYPTGDFILAEVAKELNHHLGESELAARISADNFVCLLKYVSDKAIAKRGNAFQKRCNDHLASIDNRLKVQFTSGIYKVNQGETGIPSLVGKADIAHKTIGDVNKAPLVFYDDKIQNEFLRKKKLESSMSTALRKEEFQIYLQPKFNLINHKIIGTEALVRWQHPSEGLISPDQFIPLFESNGFILELDFYVYEKVCSFLRKWIDEEKPVMPVSVNVSKAHLATERFASRLEALIQKYDIPPRLLELELTESIFIDDSQEAVSLIRDLKDMGFTILIDDFGSGYSSLHLLKDIPVDILKLDKEFFRIEGMEEKDKIIVDGIIRIANDLDLKVISEGIETQEQVDFLIRSGCRKAQGYFFARPMSITDYETFDILGG
ncbi:MAG: EAL domain-containing protein, partial [Bacillota bacterium]